MALTPTTARINVDWNSRRKCWDVTVRSAQGTVSVHADTTVDLQYSDLWLLAGAVKRELEAMLPF